MKTSKKQSESTTSTSRVGTLRFTPRNKSRRMHPNIFGFWVR
ncbi:MAG: hypothetical protein RR034_00510 [Bacteroidales bacterium]